MNEPIRQIAGRLRGLREALELTPAEIAQQCGIPEADYLQAESGTADISVSLLQKIARHYDVPLDALMFGEEPRMNSYFLTRAGKGTSIERTKAYKYEALAGGFIHRKADPFIVTVEPKEEDVPMYYNTHPGQEFNLILEGEMLLSVGGKELTLHTGDSIYFNAVLPHGMKALGGKPVRFLAVIL
ncbi:MAG: XRE family transcriptional regulator [Bacteroides sp.]|nr:XRE family transcriptional regulator [Bacteroides sp.]